ncbi:hypothetical protein L2E82_06465 [Cichorium intybus]|uniref:Uncharacterized protein n=1 Tax=Cichorium intybus TaxID=13427 RepID=A0ACB9HCB6_CICIN|nr:hypothetical protein L2E82_06465 [Cichorium intybus]
MLLLHHSIEPRSLSFVLKLNNLTYSVKVRSKVLWNDISGEARDDKSMAALGASGSGKSTLIDTLANRIPKGGLIDALANRKEQMVEKMIAW